MSTLANIGKNIVEMVSSAIKLRSIPVEDIRDVIKENVKRHKRMHDMIKLIGAQDYKKLYTRYLDNIKISKCPSKDVYNQYVKGLTGKALSDERTFPMCSLANSNDDFVDILEDIEKNLNKLIEDKVMNLNNVRMTGISILGILKQSNILVNFTMYVYGQFTTAISGDTNEIPQYRSNYLNNHVNKVSLIVSQVRNKQGAYMFLEEAKQLKSKNADMVLNASQNGLSFINLINTSNYTKGFLDNLETVLSVLNIFRWTQEKWDDYMYECYQENKETLAWMESNVAILRMELSNIDPNDPKYRQLKKVIEAYDMRIAEYDKKIDDYEKGE